MYPTLIKQTFEAQEGDMILRTCTAGCVGSVYPYSGMRMKVDLQVVLDASQLEMTVRSDKDSG